MGRERIWISLGDRAIWTEQLIRWGSKRGEGEDDTLALSDIHSFREQIPASGLHRPGLCPQIADFSAGMGGNKQTLD